MILRQFFKASSIMQLVQLNFDDLNRFKLSCFHVLICCMGSVFSFLRFLWFVCLKIKPWRPYALCGQ